MKKYIFIPLLAVLIISISSCGDDNSKAGSGSSATADTAQSVSGIETNDTAESVTEQTAPSTEGTTKKNKKKDSAGSTKETTVNTTASTAVQNNIPKDNISSENINPNIGSIQGNVAAEIEALSVKQLSLSRAEVELKEGESIELEIGILPENAADKRLKLTLSNSNASAEVSGTVLRIKGEKAGECKVSITSHNGLEVSCVVTVTAAETEPSETSQTE